MKQFYWLHPKISERTNRIGIYCILTYSLGSTTQRYSYNICISKIRNQTNKMNELMNEVPS